MNLSLGGIVKGVTTGLETLVETGNPCIAAGAGALACFSGSGAARAGAPVQTFDPLLDQMSAELNSGGAAPVHSYMQLAGLDANGKPTQNDAYGGVTDADLVY